MHKKIRGRMVCLYRSRWVPKGAQQNTHGYAEQRYVGSIPVDAQTVPAPLANVLTEKEREYVETSVCRPARETAERERREAAAREADPLWRLREATRLVAEAAECSRRLRVPRARTSEVQDALGTVQLIEQSETKPAVRKPDALQDALASIRAAAVAVKEGQYGQAPTTGVRSTRAYRLWSEIYDAVCGAQPGSLMRVLQDRGFAKSRQR